MKKQIRIKDDFIIVECCDDCPCWNDDTYICQILQSNPSKKYVNDVCPLEDAE